jgi:hypothetical protein
LSAERLDVRDERLPSFVRQLIRERRHQGHPMATVADGFTMNGM